MIFPKAKKIARELGWHKTNNGVFGLYKGYFFNIWDASILSSPQYKFVQASMDPLTQEQLQQINSALEKDKKALKFTSYEFQEDGILFQFAENLTLTKIKTVYTLMDYLVELFRQAGIPEQLKCSTCTSEENLDYYTVNGNGVILCNACNRTLEKTFYEVERERLNEQKNYLTGFLGSVVFSLPGIIAWVLLAVFLNRIAAFMAILIAFLGIKGYNFFKGKHGTITKYLIVLSNILCILIANLVTVVALLMGEGLSINQAIVEMQGNSLVLDILYENITISFILALFVWIWLLFVLKESKMEVKLAEKFSA